MKRVNDLFPNWFTSGGVTSDDFTGFISNLIYPYLPSQDRPSFQVPYETSVFPSYTYGNKTTWLASLDVLFSSRFGNRKLMPFIENLDLHTKASEPITADQIANTNTIAQMVNIRYADKWNHIAEALGIEYDPLENYHRTEDSSYEHNTGADNYDSSTFGKRLDGDGSATDPISESANDLIDKKSIKGGWTDGDTTSITTQGEYDKTITTDNDIFGFDSGSGADDGMPANHSVVTEHHNYNDPDNDAYVEQHGGAVTRDYHGKEGDTVDPDYTEKTGRSGSEFTKHHIKGLDDGWDHSEIFGNIGVKDNMQMLQSEVDVRKANILYDIILSDIADFLCVSIY